MDIQTIMQIIQASLVILSLTFSLILLIKKRKNANSNDEKALIDELILEDFEKAVAHIRMNYGEIATTKQLKKGFKKVLKEEVDYGKKTRNQCETGQEDIPRNSDQQESD